ncbi:hypothetical protein LINPERPRIM_LOCUS37946 [Linum perenne]
MKKGSGICLATSVQNKEWVSQIPIIATSTNMPKHVPDVLGWILMPLLRSRVNPYNPSFLRMLVMQWMSQIMK